MANFTLTTGPDIIVGGVSDDTVNGTAATLNAGDELTGGAGIDELALYGSGLYRLDQLATFTGFENITLNNFSGGVATLYLGSQSIAVTAYGSGSDHLYLGSGAITFLGGIGSYTLYSTSPSTWENYGLIILKFWNLKHASETSCSVANLQQRHYSTKQV